jgi:spermidine synthase
VYYGDGRRFIKETDERFDIVIVNMPDPSTAMLNRFYTREFFSEAKRVMASGGGFSTRLSAPVDYYGREVGSYAGSVYCTLKSVFPQVLVAPGEENYFFAATRPGVITSDVVTLQERWRGRGIQTAYFTPHHFLNWWLPERVSFTTRSLAARGRGRINTDFKPLTYYFNLILWTRFSGSRIAGFLNAVEKVSFAWYLTPLVVLFLARLLYVLGLGKRGDRQDAFHTLLAIGSMGFSAMALEIVLVFAFQNVYGYVYQMIGMIVALFMVGLACGGFTSNRYLDTPRRRWPLWLAGIAFLLALYSLITPIIIRRVTSLGIRSEYVFMGLVFLTGFIAGTEFPIASKIYMRYAASIGKSAARVNGFDQLGACAGSLLTGIVFVPLLGIYATCIFVAVMNAACGMLLLIGHRRE